MARKQLPAKELQRRRRAREIKKKRNEQETESDDEDEENDACAICDNGGGLTCCDGGCQRSFHLADQESEDSECRLALGITEEEAKMIIEREEAFICKNCKYKQHQCFVCGMLGSSDLSSGAEVYQCEHEDCGHFYHPKCVADLLYPDNEEATLFEIQIAAGEKFTCPMHECIICKGGEDKNHEETQFAVCRRCPTAYHRKCLPSDIPFKSGRGRYGAIQRAWEGILRDRILIYCMKHQIDRDLGTPKRNHIIFPEEEEPSDHPSPEPSQPPPSASDTNQCSCSSPIHSFAPSSLFQHPQPGSCGWLGD
ncbi:hypothetical protein ACP70R_019903 [Stipagrostis hirtigluma subsp. patula]